MAWEDDGAFSLAFSKRLLFASLSLESNDLLLAAFMGSLHTQAHTIESERAMLDEGGR